MNMQPLFYVILGTRESSRVKIMQDLCHDLLHRMEGTIGLVGSVSDSEWAEIARLAEGDATGRLQCVAMPAPESPLKEFCPACETVFYLVEEGENPVDAIERVHGFLAETPFVLGRIITTVNTHLLYGNGRLKPWYEACIHFSDYVFLANREGVPDKWIREYQLHFTKECLPCHVELLRKTGVKHPALVLEPEARRLSQYFDEEVNLPVAPETLDPDWPAIEYEDDPLGEEDGEDEDPTVDHYIKRTVAGRREVVLPDMRGFWARRTEGATDG